VQAWPDILQAVTEDDIKAVAAKVFNRDQSVTGWVVASQEEAR
jgi:zinc protease